MNLMPQGIVGWAGERGGADFGPLLMVAQHVGLSDSFHTLGKERTE